MPGNDWIVGGNRRTIAAERIYAAATDLITRYGLNALDIDKLAREVHCSRATIYRRAGGKAQIRDVVLTRAAARIADGVRSDVETLRGAGASRRGDPVIASANPIRPAGQAHVRLDPRWRR